MATPDPTPSTPDAGLEQHVHFSTTADLDDDWLRRLPEVTGVTRDRGEFVVTGDAQMLFSVVSLLAAHDIVPLRLHVDHSTVEDASTARSSRTRDTDGA